MDNINYILLAVVAVVAIVILLTVAKKVIKFAVVVVLFGAIVIGLISIVGGQSDIEWENIIRNRYSTYKEYIENSPEIQGIYQEIQVKSKDLAGKAKDEALKYLIQQLEKEIQKEISEQETIETAVTDDTTESSVAETVESRNNQ
jgi:ABC-type multidrug transport system fused ATPase/permease subunit